MSTHNISFYGEIRKIITKYSSLTIPLHFAKWDNFCRQEIDSYKYTQTNILGQKYGLVRN